jgi:hypothetical protein
LVANAGSIVRRTYFRETAFRLEPLSQVPRHFGWAGNIFQTNELEPDMSKVVRVSPSIPASQVSSRASDNHQLISIALFSGIGLLISLVAVLLGVQGMWF